MQTCEMGSKLAKADFEKGAYFIIRWGLPEPASILRGEILEKEFGIQQVYGGCVPRDEVECYTSTMYSLLQGKYGYAFYKQARKKD